MEICFGDSEAKVCTGLEGKVLEDRRSVVVWVDVASALGAFSFDEQYTVDSLKGVASRRHAWGILRRGGGERGEGGRGSLGEVRR